MRRRAVFTIFFVLSVWFFNLSVWALHIIDIEQTAFGQGYKHQDDDKPQDTVTTQHPLVRLIDFDVDNQKFSRVDYYMTPTKKEYSFTYKGIKISYGFTVVEEGSASKGDMSGFFIKVDATNIVDAAWCFSPVEPEAKHSSSFSWVGRKNPERFVAANKKRQYLASGGIKEFLDKFKDKRDDKKHPFKISFRTSENDFCSSYYLTGTGEGSVSTLIANGCKRELGELGEIAMDMTFLSYGFVKLPSKITGGSGGGGGDKGFDGIYIKENDTPQKILWIGEAKFHHGTLSEKDMKAALSSKFPLEQYTQSKDKLLQQTGEKIEAYFLQHPTSVFLLGYNIMSSGSIKTPFIENYNEFKVVPTVPAQALLLTPASSLAEKEKGLKDVLSSFLEKTSLSPSDLVPMIKRIYPDMEGEKGAHAVKTSSKMKTTFKKKVPGNKG